MQSLSRKHICPPRTRRYSRDGSNGAQYPARVNLEVIHCNHCHMPMPNVYELVEHKSKVHQMGGVGWEERSALQSSLGGINQ